MLIWGSYSADPPCVLSFVILYLKGSPGDTNQRSECGCCRLGGRDAEGGSVGREPVGVGVASPPHPGGGGGLSVTWSPPRPSRGAFRAQGHRSPPPSPKVVCSQRLSPGRGHWAVSQESVRLWAGPASIVPPAPTPGRSLPVCTRKKGALDNQRASLLQSGRRRKSPQPCAGLWPAAPASLTPSSPTAAGQGRNAAAPGKLPQRRARAAAVPSEIGLRTGRASERRRGS